MAKLSLTNLFRKTRKQPGVTARNTPDKREEQARLARPRAAATHGGRAPDDAHLL